MSSLGKPEDMYIETMKPANASRMQCERVLDLAGSACADDEEQQHADEGEAGKRRVDELIELAAGSTGLDRYVEPVADGDRAERREHDRQHSQPQDDFRLHGPPLEA